MSNWLNPDNKFFTFMGKVFDLLVLNTVWLLLCVPLPVLTIVWLSRTENFLFLILTALTLLPIVPATTALYYAVVKSIRRERSYAVKEYFRSFVRNIKQGSIFSAIALVLIIILYIDFSYALGLMEAQMSSGSLYLGVFLVISLLFGAMYVYLCPLLSRFEMKTTAMLKTAFVMGARHLLTTVLLLVLVAATLLGCYILLPGMFFLPALATLVSTFLIERVFKKYMPEKEETEYDAVGEEIGREKDEWYLE